MYIFIIELVLISIYFTLEAFMTIGPSDFIVAVEFIDSIECPGFIGFIKKEIHELFNEN